MSSIHPIYTSEMEFEENWYKDGLILYLAQSVDCFEII